MESTYEDILQDEANGFNDAQRLLDAGWPWPLAKATVDEFFYAVGLRDGRIIEFTEATASKNMEWATLDVRDGQTHSLDFIHDDSYDLSRGIVIRVADVVWAIDAPHGS